ncbi:50S ribosomal protein L25 [Acidobacteria bacterium AH-259-L09]|nr:50S ribosomal protein L25 [Acidobacteria bacterium AH-259-L09]
MADIVIEGEERRELGKNANRRLRAEGKIPAVVYGHGLDTLPLSVNPKDLDRILHSETGHNTIFKLEFGGGSRDVLIKDYQLDPIDGNLLHADFQAVVMDEVMIFEVPVQTVGTSKGVKAGGVLDMVLREIEMECLPQDVPDHVRMDVAELDVGDSVRVEDLQIDTSKIAVLSNPELVVLTIVPPHVEREVEEVVEVEEEVAEPELITKGKVEAEEETEAKEE